MIVLVSTALLTIVNAQKLTRVNALILDPDEGNCLGSAAIDPQRGFAYFGTTCHPFKVYRVRLQDFTRYGALNLEKIPGVDQLVTAILDSAAGYLYFGAGYATAKIKLSDFLHVATLPFGTIAAIDTANRHAYYYYYVPPILIIAKVNLQTDTVLQTLSWRVEEFRPPLSFFDFTNGFAYFGIHTPGATPGTFIKASLANFEVLGNLTLVEGSLSTGVIDIKSGFAYFGMESVPGYIVRVRLSDLAHAGVLKLNPGEYPTSAVIDAQAGYAYFGTGSSPGAILKIRLSDMTLVETLVLKEGEDALRSAVIDADHGFAYFGTSKHPPDIPGKIIKINLKGIEESTTESTSTSPRIISGTLLEYVVPVASLAMIAIILACVHRRASARPSRRHEIAGAR